MIDRKIIEEIKDRCNIEDVVRTYVDLVRAGSNYKGLCPFHSEKTPSFTVFPSTQNFYCFGCGAGGDVITFIMRTEMMEYVDAIEFLGKKAGIEVTRDETTKRSGPSRSRIIEMNREAARYFHSMLYSDGGAAGLAYLREKRQLSDATIKRFGLGFAPDSFGALRDHLKAKGFTDSELIEGSLCRRSEKNGQPYDYFRNRVMFPIIDVSGNVIAFGGRVMDDSQPKYLNSSDTPAFKKSRSLFALNYARSSCAEKLIISEGYMDVIAMHAAGFSNSVATLGTAITPDHARLIAKYTKLAILSYDSDAAGQKAAEKALKLIGETGCNAKVLKMEGAKDPDEYLKKFGRAGFEQLVNGSRSRIDFLIESVLSSHDISIPEEKIKACDELCAAASQLYSSAEKEVYAGKISEALSISKESIRDDIKRHEARNARRQKKEETRSAHLAGAGYGDRINPDFVKNVHAARAEEVILGLLLARQEHRKKLKDGVLELSADDFVTDFGKKVFNVINEGTESTGVFDIYSCGDMFSVDEMGRITKMVVAREVLTVNDENVLMDAVKALKSESEKMDQPDGGASIDYINSLISKKKSKK